MGYPTYNPNAILIASTIRCITLFSMSVGLGEIPGVPGSPWIPGSPFGPAIVLAGPGGPSFPTGTAVPACMLSTKIDIQSLIITPLVSISLINTAPSSRATVITIRTLAESLYQAADKVPGAIFPPGVPQLCALVCADAFRIASVVPQTCPTFKQSGEIIRTSKRSRTFGCASITIFDSEEPP